MDHPVGPTRQAAQAGVAGIAAAGRLHERAANTVQQAFRAPQEGAQAAGAVTPSASFGPAARVQVSGAARDLAGAYVDMTRAEGMSKASVAVLRTADEMSQELSDLLGSNQK